MLVTDPGCGELGVQLNRDQIYGVRSALDTTGGF